MQVSQAEASAAFEGYHSRNFFVTRPSAGKLRLGPWPSLEEKLRCHSSISYALWPLLQGFRM